MSDPTVPEKVGDNEQATGLPLIRSWQGVYLLVLAIFVTWVVLLTVLSRAFT